MELEAIDPPIILMDALHELSIQLGGLEDAASFYYNNLLPIITTYKEQTSDYMYRISTWTMSDEQVKLNLPIDVPKVDKEKIKSSYGSIFIKVSNHQYVPKVLHPQTIVTYMSDSK